MKNAVMDTVTDKGVAYVVDDDLSMRKLIEATLKSAGIEAQTFPSGGAFAVENPVIDRPSCILLDLEMPRQSGLQFLDQHFGKRGLPCPVIIVTAHASVQTAVKSMKMGAVDLLEKPFDREILLALVQSAIEKDRQRRALLSSYGETRRRLESLTLRESELLAAVVAGKSTKMIADEFAISPRTVDHHRANMMEKMHAANVADLVRMAINSGFEPPPSTASPAA